MNKKINNVKGKDLKFKNYQEWGVKSKSYLNIQKWLIRDL